MKSVATPTRPLIIAHRGLHSIHPENSLEAFAAAADAGVSWVEFDVQSSRDGWPVVIHDRTLDRTTMTRGPVAARLSDDLRRVHLRRLGDGAPETHSLLPVLRFDWTLGALSNTGLSLLVEVKPPNSPRLINHLAQCLRSHPPGWVIQSFDLTNLVHAKRYAPTVERALLVETEHQLYHGVHRTRLPLNVRHDLVDRELVALLREQGRDIGVWTVNNERSLRRVNQLGVDAIITDEPQLAMQIAAESKE